MSLLSHPIPFDSSKQSPFPHLYYKGSPSSLSPLESPLCVRYLLLCNQHVKTKCFKTTISLSLRWVDYWSVLTSTAKFSRGWVQLQDFWRPEMARPLFLLGSLPHFFSAGQEESINRGGSRCCRTS